jgi:hypothetical protein
MPGIATQERTMPWTPIAGTYDAAVLSVLEQAYSSACREIDIDPHPIDPSSNKVIREALAKATMDMAAIGLRDPTVLRAWALEAVRNLQGDRIHRPASPQLARLRRRVDRRADRGQTK